VTVRQLLTAEHGPNKPVSSRRRVKTAGKYFEDEATQILWYDKHLLLAS
jgi:hypothetical protein